ncbi:DMT family transporter [Alkalihalobacillus deserti]|uniref:DMT family transporter n=1 Tax=Alkalihalobacillus deserti TaxID=2879466 RepID=UPI001D14E455|nr:DMT family transporter [Alkalihalobacillus deserti]
MEWTVGMKNKSLVFTYGVVFFVMITWGLNVVLLKVLVEAFSPVTMTAFRVMIAGIAAITIVLFGRSIRKLTKKEWHLTFLAALFGSVGHHYFLATGLTLTNASNAVLILALLPLTTSILAVIFLKDCLTKWRLFGISVAFVGVLLIQGGTGKWSIDLGEFYVFLAMFFQAVSFIYIKKATESLDSKQMTSLMLLLGSVGLLIISLIIEPTGFKSLTSGSFMMYLLFFISSIFATTVGHFLFNAAIQKIGAGQTAIFNNFVPFFGLIFSAIFLKEQVYWYQSFGFMFIVVGVLFGTGYIERSFLKNKHHSVQEKGM